MSIPVPTSLTHVKAHYLCRTNINVLVSDINKVSSTKNYRHWQVHTFKAFWDWEVSIPTGAGHWVAAPVGFVQAIERNVFSMENSVGFQICDPELLGSVEDAASFDTYCARSWKRKRREKRMQRSSWCPFSPDVGHLLKCDVISIVQGCQQHQQGDNSAFVFHHSPLQTGLVDQFPVFWHDISASPSRT